MRRRVQHSVRHPVRHHVRMATMHGQMFTAGEAARACGVSRTTISRAAAAGRIPGAERDEAGAWTLPLSGLLAAGYNPGKPSPPEAPVSRPGDGDASVPAEVYELTLELERARAEARVQAARAEALERLVVVYERQLEAPRETVPVAAQTPPQSASDPIRTRVSAEPLSGNVGRWRRAWNVVRYS